MLPKWRTYPKPSGFVDKRAIWKKRLSYSYLFFASNAVMLVLYAVVKGKGDWVGYFGLREENEGYKYPSQFWIEKKKLADDNLKVFRVSGFNVEDISEKVHNKTEGAPQNQDKEL